MNDKHIMSLPRKEYDAQLKEIQDLKTENTRINELLDENLGAIIMVRSEREIQHWMNRGNPNIRSLHERVEFLQGTEEFEEYFDKHVLKYVKREDVPNLKEKISEQRIILFNLKQKLKGSVWGIRAVTIRAAVKELEEYLND